MTNWIACLGQRTGTVPVAICLVGFCAVLYNLRRLCWRSSLCSVATLEGPGPCGGWQIAIACHMECKLQLMGALAIARHIDLNELDERLARTSAVHRAVVLYNLQHSSNRAQCNQRRSLCSVAQPAPFEALIPVHHCTTCTTQRPPCSIEHRTNQNRVRRNHHHCYHKHHQSIITIIIIIITSISNIIIIIGISNIIMISMIIITLLGNSPRHSSNSVVALISLHRKTPSPPSPLSPPSPPCASFLSQICSDREFYCSGASHGLLFYNA